MESFSQRVIISPDILFKDLHGESVILDLKSGKYYGLNEVGTRLWNLLLIDPDIAVAYNTLLEEYDVPEEQLTRDIFAIIEHLVSVGLITIT